MALGGPWVLWTSLLGALLLGGCAQDNGILTVTFTLPAASGARAFALVEAQDSDDAFIGEGGDRVAEPLLAGATTTSVVEIVATEDKVNHPFRLRVRFCGDADCSGDGDTVGKALSVEYLFVRAFYAHKRTSISLTIPDQSVLETTPADRRITVGQCEVMGCGPAEALSWCREDASHLCE